MSSRELRERDDFSPSAVQSVIGLHTSQQRVECAGGYDDDDDDDDDDDGDCVCACVMSYHP